MQGEGSRQGQGLHVLFEPPTMHFVHLKCGARTCRVMAGKVSTQGCFRLLQEASCQRHWHQEKLDVRQKLFCWQQGLLEQAWRPDFALPDLGIDSRSVLCHCAACLVPNVSGRTSTAGVHLVQLAEPSITRHMHFKQSVNQLPKAS